MRLIEEGVVGGQSVAKHSRPRTVPPRPLRPGAYPSTYTKLFGNAKLRNATNDVIQQILSIPGKTFQATNAKCGPKRGKSGYEQYHTRHMTVRNPPPTT